MLKHLPNFISHEECDAFIKQIDDIAAPSQVISTAANVSVDSEWRISDTAAFSDVHETIGPLKQRIADELNFRVTQGEPIQGFRYHEGGFFGRHTDWFSFEQLQSDGWISGNRSKTLIVYLNDDFTGGETNFPNVSRALTPKKGDAWIWDNIINGRCSDESLHESLPILTGTKYILSSFWREFDFDPVGDREYYKSLTP